MLTGPRDVERVDILQAGATALDSSILRLVPLNLRAPCACVRGTAACWMGLGDSCSLEDMMGTFR